MEAHYLEERTIEGPTTYLAADVAKHLQARQHLGKTMVICEKPANLMASVRKQWLKLARQLQRERSSTINAEKILRLTAAITHMHHMRFTAKSPYQQPNAHVYFVNPAVDIAPDKLYSLYITEVTPKQTQDMLFKQLPNEALVIDYTQTITAQQASLIPKRQLQGHVTAAWQKVISFTEAKRINIASLANPATRTYIEVDDALDTLLANSQQFLAVASDFQHTLELAQPIYLDVIEQRKYDVLILLAHRVQALSPDSSHYRFTTALNDEDSFFLHDIAVENDSFAYALSQAIMHRQLTQQIPLAPALAL